MKDAQGFLTGHSGVLVNAKVIDGLGLVVYLLDFWFRNREP